ncbi:hypothetical protein Y032_0067g75 [Ancylostoma ceylanicum]|uniref:Uncharacterized protein n=1 Tax=Ancylostoma ceylanicum TaxID=53326 RepID=A0A016U0V6_9BILA|nr:hypothetical protein Y032_0067g75 [Ancylostoma ceylanicum]
MLHIFIPLTCIQQLLASLHQLDLLDETPKAYGSSVEYTYEYDSSKHTQPIIKVTYEKLDEREVKKLLDRDYKRAEGVKSLPGFKRFGGEERGELIGRNDRYAMRTSWHQARKDPYRHSSYPDELFNFVRDSSDPWMNDFTVKNYHVPFDHNNYKNMPGIENFDKEGPPASVQELIEDMTSFMYKQTGDILSSHFPMFPNPFAEESPYKIPFPQIDVRKYNKQEQIYDK